MFLRRHGLLALLAGWGSLSLPAPAHAGNQIEEPLADSVRSALSAAVSDDAPPVPEFADTESRLRYLRWLGNASGRLRKQKPDWNVRREFLQTLWYESRRAGLDPALVLGLVQVDFKKRSKGKGWWSWSLTVEGQAEISRRRLAGEGPAGRMRWKG